MLRCVDGVVPFFAGAAGGRKAAQQQGTTEPSRED
jgi:hypothetical protein